MRREAQVGDLLASLGVELTNTCVPYEAAYVPSFGERLAWGDTGAAAFANGAIGARTNFEGGVAGLWAALTGRTPGFGFQLDDARRATCVCSVSGEFDGVTDWAVLGALIGERLPGYSSVPLIEVNSRPTRDALKGLAASLASYGSIGMFHVSGVTPEALTLDAGHARPHVRVERFDIGDVRKFYERSLGDEMPSLVVFTAPQLSVQEVSNLAEIVGDRHFHRDVTVIVTTSPSTRDLLARSAVERLEEAGAMVVEGSCWYLMDPARMRSQFGWRRVLTNSPKLANIIPASGYVPIVRPFEVCVEAAVTGRLGTSTN